ncbi:MAG: hypothetical protein ACKO7P_14335 [Bacteroidota bacterium]
MRDLKNFASSISVNLGGKRINRKIVVIESDDWGSIRMPSSEVCENLIKAGIPLKKSAYCCFDGLESNSDIEELYTILKRIKTRFNKEVRFTLNFVTANPDFARIKQNNFSTYFSESIIDTYRKYKASDSVISMINEGVSEGIFIPQFHGREHVNVPFWMSLLVKDENFRIAFDQEVFGLSNDIFPKLEKSVQATYDTLDLEYQNNSLSEGLVNFENIFGFKSKSFISNNYILSDSSFDILKKNGVEVIQGMKYQKLPIKADNRKRKLIKRSFGEIDFNSGLKFSIRNCTFEPTEIGDTVESTMKQIKIAFLMKKPAVLSTHRINFTSRISVENRDKNLKEFEELLSRIILTWPDVQFLNSVEALSI